MTWLRKFLAEYEIYVCLGLCLFFFGLGVYVDSKFSAAAEKERLEASINAHIKNEQAANLKAMTLETKLAAMREQNLKDNEAIKNEIKKPEYRYKLPPGGVQAINRAVAGNLPR